MKMTILAQFVTGIISVHCAQQRTRDLARKNHRPLIVVSVEANEESSRIACCEIFFFGLVFSSTTTIHKASTAMLSLLDTMFLG
jgi:hypothetical protein